MIYLTGVANPAVLAVAQGRDDLGLLAQPDGHDHRLAEWPRWGADNGCYAAGDRFDLTRWLAWLDLRSGHRAACLFAACPDVVGDWRATLTRSLPVLEVVRSRGYPAAIVAQDGWQHGPPPPWPELDAVFIGGSTGWKMSEHAFRAADEARDHGKHVHVGRVNSGARFSAWAAHADSADGTFLAFGPTVNLPRLVRWLDQWNHAPTLWTERSAR